MKTLLSFHIGLFIIIITLKIEKINVSVYNNTDENTMNMPSVDRNSAKA